MMNKEAFYKITYGLYLIATKHGGKMNGYIGNTVFQVTANPPQLAISCSKDNYSMEMIRSSSVFSVSVIDEQASSEMIGLFGYQSGKETDKFAKIQHKTGKSGTPIVLNHCIAWFECRVVKEVDLGTHILFIGEIMDNELISLDKNPMTYEYYQTVKKGRAPKNAPTYIEHESNSTESALPEKEEYHTCTVCGYEYDPEVGDPENGIPPGTPFENLPQDWHCPTCGADLEMFD